MSIVILIIRVVWWIFSLFSIAHARCLQALIAVMNEQEESSSYTSSDGWLRACVRVLSHDERHKERSSESVIVHTQVFDKR